MPRYFFHLSFGGRTWPDEEGIELPNRSATRAEAAAVIRDLSRHGLEEDRRRWAGWILHVADAQGQFLSLPIDAPALGLVSQQPQPKPAPGRLGDHRIAALAQRILELRERTTHLLDQNRQLREELAVAFRHGAQLRLRARELLSSSRPLKWGSLDLDIATALPHRSRPHLVVLPGGLR